jgi:uncharacterized protein involved in type VI secretion and phage assembly
MMDALVSPRANEAEREADGFIQGLAVGVVTDNEDPDGLARVRVRLPWHADGDTSFWARMAMPMAGSDRGTYFLPEIGDEVLMGAENGDPSHFYVLGMLWNGQSLPPATNDDGNNNTRLIRSRSGHELRFNDDESNPEVELKLEDGKRLLIDKDGVIVEDGQGNTIKIESASGAITITAGQQLKLKSTSVSIEADASMEIKASGTLTLRGAMVQIN